ncbi:hypothetical protein [Streptomyces sp. NBC_01451]|uniref:hypothetical protein n=1 Tax=Streptomyces sp. NBC_01451 TaxID=2903872 RepID=UPI002E31C58B|nr:hypothetical protein [Streptomyces sp. NBC_01451]
MAEALMPYVWLWLTDRSVPRDDAATHWELPDPVAAVRHAVAHPVIARAESPPPPT